ncbi:hypothetical protein EK0264_03785 [Epidermidibacterium keratini]|uniref:Uncharacterized protein n=1 Tax=Epidermidibacterium keratini TaxID=1891644 RepID=A0A7L4YK79_9ACTN|nr:hypothetical protein [Epidermidibacterium keratini]QHB99491.1 hypothetical protein EK0264_03785 [Epidermidibacterium keratini]
MIITSGTVTRREIRIDRITHDDAPATDVAEVAIDALDVIHETTTTATYGDGTITVPVGPRGAGVALPAGTAARYRIRGLPGGPRIVTIPAGTDPIGIDELPEAPA